MSIPAHFVNVYQKPAQGNTFLKRYQAFNYRHSIRAVGWFDTASCDIAVRSIKEGERFLEQYIGNRVAVYVDNPMEPIWEGMITRITFQQGTGTFTNSMDEMTNRVAVTYSQSGATNVSAFINNTNSQAIYGIKEQLLQLNVDTNTVTAARRDAIRALRLAVHAWPITSVVFNGSGQRGVLKIEMQGFYRTLDWDHTDGGASSGTPDVIIKSVVQANVNGTTFFDDTDTSLIIANTAWTVGTAPNQTGLTRWQYIQSVQEAGDGVSRWIAGIGPTDPNLGTRRFYYRKADATFRYIVLQHDGLGIIRNIYGQKVNPWRVTPDGQIRLNDVLVGWDLQGDDPRASYLEAVQYDAERQSVAWQSKDDVTFDGIFRLSSFYNPVESTTGGVGRPPIRQSP